MLTQDDLEKIREIMELAIEVKVEPMVERLLSEKIGILPTRDEYLTEMDKIYGELQEIRETLEIQSGYRIS